MEERIGFVEVNITWTNLPVVLILIVMEERIGLLQTLSLNLWAVVLILIVMEERIG